MEKRISRLSTYTQNKLLELFVWSVTARSVAALTGINLHSAMLYYHKIREIIALEIADETSFDGEIELDESCFGGVRKGTRLLLDADIHDELNKLGESFTWLVSFGSTRPVDGELLKFHRERIHRMANRLPTLFSPYLYFGDYKTKSTPDARLRGHDGVRGEE